MSLPTHRIPIVAYEEGPALPFPPPIAGSETFGVPRWPLTSMGLGDDGQGGGRYTLVPLSDAGARELVAGDVRLVLTGAGVKRVDVLRCRTGVAHYADGVPYEVPVVDVTMENGRARALAPCDVYDVRAALSATEVSV
jgi:hypothetical protein